MFGTKKPYNLGVWPRFWLYGIFMFQKPYKSGISRTSGNAARASTVLSVLHLHPRLLQRVRLGHLRCNSQNMTSLVCHSNKCTRTQYALLRCGWLCIRLFCLLIQYRKLFWKVLKNFAKYREILPKISRNNLKIFKRKIGKFLELLQRISRNIS